MALNLKNTRTFHKIQQPLAKHDISDDVKCETTLPIRQYPGQFRVYSLGIHRQHVTLAVTWKIVAYGKN